MTGPDIERVIRANLWGDLVVQAATALAWALYLPGSGWLALMWIVRWVVVAAIAAALLIIRRGQADRALAILICGHAFGIIGTAAIVPEGAPITMLVAVGDLVILVPFTSLRRAVHLAGLLAMAGSVAAGLSLQSWTGLAQQAPSWLVIVIAVSHIIGSVVTVAAGAHGAEVALIDRLRSLGEIRRRTASAAQVAAEDIRAELARGPGNHLGELEALARETGRALIAEDITGARRAANAALDCAQLTLGEVRSISHGIFPDVLRRSGLAAAVLALGSESGSTITARVDEVDVQEPCVMAIYGLVAAAHRLIEPHQLEHLDVHVRPAPAEGQVAFSVEVLGRLGAGPPPVLPQAVVDRIGAVAGTVTTSVEPGRWRADGLVPRQLLDVEPSATRALRRSGGAHGPVVADTRRLDASLVVGTALVASAATFLITGSLALAIAAVPGAWLLALEIVLRRGGRRRNGQRIAFVLAVQQSFVALAVSIVIPWFSPAMVCVATRSLTASGVRFTSRWHRLLSVVQAAVAGACTFVGLLHRTTVGEDTSPSPAVAWSLPFLSATILGLIAYEAISSQGRLVGLVTATRRSLAQLVVAVDHERQRIERDLHDGAQQHLVAVSLQLRAVVALIDRGTPERAAAILDELHAELELAARELDELSAGAFPADLLEGDLSTALASVARSAAVPVTVRVTGPVPATLSPNISSSLYFCCLEAIQNAAKHGRSDVSVSVTIEQDRSALRIRVSDDGGGLKGPLEQPGRGLLNIQQRMEAIGGDWSISSRDGEGCDVSLSVPLERMRPGVARLV